MKATAGTADLWGSLTWNDERAYRLMSTSSVIEPPVDHKNYIVSSGFQLCVPSNSRLL